MSVLHSRKLRICLILLALLSAILLLWTASTETAVADTYPVGGDSTTITLYYGSIPNWNYYFYPIDDDTGYKITSFHNAKLEGGDPETSYELVSGEEGRVTATPNLGKAVYLVPAEGNVVLYDPANFSNPDRLFFHSFFLIPE